MKQSNNVLSLAIIGILIGACAVSSAEVAVPNYLSAIKDNQR